MIKFFKVGHQVYLIPAIKLTYSKRLNGHLGIDIIWLNLGIEIRLN